MQGGAQQQGSSPVPLAPGGSGSKRRRNPPENPSSAPAADRPAPSSQDPVPQGEEAPGGEAEATKHLRITDSCIHGIAQPHKPRVGVEYQAVVPPWQGPPAPPQAGKPQDS